VFPTRILLATNGGGEAALAEEAAVELASGTGSELHVVHVVSTVPEMPYPHASTRERHEAMLEARRLRGLRLLDARVGRIEDLGGRISATHYREGSVQKEILRLAEELEAGLIVTGGRKRPWFERLFGAGLSERISRRARRPVLVVDGRASRGSAVRG
jgi:nucleotide-binding universal stress UspA family protein